MVKFNYIFLVGDEVIAYQLQKHELNILNEFNHRNLYEMYDDKFHIDYINDYFNDFKFYRIWEINKNKITKMDINSTKTKILDSFVVLNQKDFIEKILNVDLIHGRSVLLKNLKTILLKAKL